MAINGEDHISGERPITMVTNDNGIDASGLRSLIRVLVSTNLYEVRVALPILSVFLNQFVSDAEFLRMAMYLLYESSSGYGLFEVHGLDEIGQNTEAVRSSVSDLSRFGRVVQLTAFHPFESALDALNQVNAVSEGIHIKFIVVFL
uniref:Nucleolar protein 58/56 N-terminal domain-containing protein n=1 Tax=Brassica oleracea var. oleracea TaxID=109376 RepID=A0A0D3D8H9_BRAOL